MVNSTEETQPHVKEHNGTKICFADTITQARNALAARQAAPTNDQANTDIHESTHLMLFGVEKWDNARQFGDALVGHNFTRLEIFGTDMSAEAQRYLAVSFGKGALSTVSKLDLDNTKLHKGAAQQIMTHVASPNSIVEDLNLQGSIDSADVLKEVMEPLQQSKTMRKIDLKINDIKHDGATHIGSFLKKMQPSSQFELDLFYNDLQKEGAIKISEGLKSPECSLTHLDMCCNNIGDEGAIAIASGLRTNRTLLSLKLALNNIGNKGAIAIFKTLYHDGEENLENVNYTLKLLDLSANVMKDESPAAGDDKEAAKADKHEAAIDKAHELNLKVDKLRMEGKEEEAAQLELQLNAQVDLTQDQSPLVSTLTKVLTEAYGLQDFDFTGIELDDQGWSGLGTCLGSTLSFVALKSDFLDDAKRNMGDQKFDEVFHGVQGDPMTIRFSIVDLMSETRLKKMEEVIWDGDLKEKFYFIDWRRREDPKKEEKKEDKKDDN